MSEPPTRCGPLTEVIVELYQSHEYISLADEVEMKLKYFPIFLKLSARTLIMPGKAWGNWLLLLEVMRKGANSVQRWRKIKNNSFHALSHNQHIV